MFTHPLWGGGGALLPPVFIGSLNVADEGSGPYTLNISAHCPVGSVVVCFGESVQEWPWGSVTDSRGNTYTQIENISDSVNGISLAVYYSVLTTALQIGDAITVAVHGYMTFRCVNVLRNTASPSDLVSGVFSGTHASSASATVASRSYAPEIIFNFLSQNGDTHLGGVSQVLGGFTTLSVLGAAVLSYRIVTFTAAIPFEISWTTHFGEYDMCFVSFKLIPA